jgi:hypothetical protein
MIKKTSSIIALIAMIVIGCVKDDGLSPTKGKDQALKSESAPDITRGEIGCVIIRGGTITCLGTRCGTPSGSCGPEYTSCECVTRGSNAQEFGLNRTFEEFKKKWNTKEGRNKLRKEGFQSIDTE